VEIETVHLPSIMDAERFGDLDYFVRHTAFVICHKSEPVDTLLSILRYIPAESPRIVVTNCLPGVFSQLSDEINELPPSRGATYLVHQKDERIAHFFRECGVSAILDANGRVRDGKGEGMYIGAIVAALLDIAEWIIYFDADNYAPSALLEYILAMSQLFTSCSGAHARHLGYRDYPASAPLHNVRICWASKPDYDGVSFVPQPRVVGRCTQVIAPICDELLRAWHPDINERLLTSNAGEQGMTMAAATALRFSSGFSIETFQLLELAFTGIGGRGGSERALLHQYLSGSPHFHEKKDEAHIRSMIADSLAGFLVYQRHLPPDLLSRMTELARDLDIRLARPITYPAIRRLPLAYHANFPAQFRLDARMEEVPA
jgi:mannosyl-3-phosphoglycerate synthase